MRGLPPGVLNLVYGDPAAISAHLIPHPVIRKISFTGSVPVGKQLAAMAGQHMKRATMELGGHSPAIVFDDADVEQRQPHPGGREIPQRRPGLRLADPLPGAGAGLRPTSSSGSRQHASAVKVGDGLDPETRMGPLVNQRRLKPSRI